MKTRLCNIALLALAALVLSACATSPTGRKQLMLVSEDSAIASSKEAYITTVGELQKEGKIETGRAINKRIDTITGRLITEAIKMRADSANWEWSMVVIDDPEMVNAWCMAGGRMAVYTGLINKIEPTDDELAQVIGHEIAHALSNHTAEKMSVQMASAAGVTVIAIISDKPGAAMAAGAVAATYAIAMPNSRAAETEADRVGIELAAKAGYDPRAAKTLWQKMAEEGGSNMPQWMSTHPNPDNRSNTLESLEDEMLVYYHPNASHPVYEF